MKLLIIFIIASIINVIISTVKSIMTVKSGKWASALINATYYGFYTWVVMLMVCELDLWAKILITALTNFIGVYVVKLIEEKARKDKIWLVKMTIPTEYTENAKAMLQKAEIPYTYYDVTKYIVFDTFCDTQAKTSMATAICKQCNGKAFATENKLGL